MKKTLLKRAKAIKTPHRAIKSYRTDAKFSQYEIEQLALAFLKTEISYTQASEVTGFKGNTLYTVFLSALRRLWDEGVFKQVKRIKKL